MRKWMILVGGVLGGSLLLGVSMTACGSSSNSTFPNGNNMFVGGDGGPNGPGFGDGSTGIPPAGGDGSVPCPMGLMCNVSCSGGGTTTISGTVYDPAGKNPLYGIAVYVPAIPLQPLPKGVLTGPNACSCGALFQSGADTSTTTAIDGTFTLKNVPVGSNVPVVIQLGKWRRQYQFNVASCSTTMLTQKLTFPTTVAAGDTNDNIPDIAVSTGGADTLECLMLRIGLDSTEYVAGASGAGHIHVFSGGLNNGNVGSPEQNVMPGAPASSTGLWSSQAQLMPYDITLLSCEGEETYNANPPALEAYLNAGGRVFGSHYHYAWFSGPLETNQNYTAPADWGTNLAMWTAGGGNSNGPIGGAIDTTLNGGGGTFAKGMLLDTWLGEVSALGQNGVPAADLSIYQPRYNALVGPANKPSQPWITAGQGAGGGQMGQTMYFSFDTPVNAVAPPDGGAPAYCGRAVFSDLHVAGNPMTNDTGNNGGGMPPPGGCDNVDLSPQEKALEFMLFDLSSCVIPDTVAPPNTIPMGVQ